MYSILTVLIVWFLFTTTDLIPQLLLKENVVPLQVELKGEEVNEQRQVDRKCEVLVNSQLVSFIISYRSLNIQLTNSEHNTFFQHYTVLVFELHCILYGFKYKS